MGNNNKKTKPVVNEELAVEKTEALEATEVEENEVVEDTEVETEDEATENVATEVEDETETETEEDKPVLEEKTDTHFKVKVVDCYYLNVRKGPSLDAEVINRLKEGTVLSVEKSENPEWLKTSTGFIMAQFTKTL